MFELVEWMQMLANIDVCVTETTPTKLVEEDGHDVTPFFMVRTIDDDTSQGPETETAELKVLRTKNEITIRDLSNSLEDTEFFYDAEPEREMDVSSNEENPNNDRETKPTKDKVFFDFHNQKPRRQHDADTLEERTQINKAAAAWDKLNARVRSFLFLSCTPQALGHVKHITSAREIWLYFNTMYNRVTPMKLAGMEIQIGSLDLKQSSSVKEHIDRLQLLRQDLSEAGKKFSSEEMAIVLLGQIWLLPRFSVFYTSLLTLGRTTPMTWEELVPLVLAQDDQHQLMKKGSSEALAGQTNSKSKGKGKETPSQSAKAPEKGKKPSSNKKKTCFECGKLGHFRKDCPDKTEAKEDSDKTAVVARSGAFVHLEVVEEGSSSQELACASGPICKWIVDSGASRHMTPSKDGLQHLRPMQGKIFIGDNSTIPIQGVGSLPLIPDGKGGSHSSEVLYAPHLGYHLLSVDSRLGDPGDTWSPQADDPTSDHKGAHDEPTDDDPDQRVVPDQLLQEPEQPARVPPTWARQTVRDSGVEDAEEDDEYFLLSRSDEEIEELLKEEEDLSLLICFLLRLLEDRAFLC
ncbi:hypothetical protein L7F22_058184 [Adiantum nelumboides]|nr:hypothetical protein [Adiantum nelumboides]